MTEDVEPPAVDVSTASALDPRRAVFSAGGVLSLRVDDSALCDAARNDGLFLLCSAYVRGDGVEIALDQHADAMEAMYRRRFLEAADVERGVVQEPPAQYAHDDLVEHVERCFEGGARD